MLLFWVVNSAEIRCAPKKTRGPTPTMRKPTLMYQRRLCIDDRPASAEGAATSRVTGRQDQLCAPLARTPSLDRYAGPMPQLPRARMTAKDRARLAAERLKALYPAVSELEHANAFQMLVATILSAQTTDRSVNSVTPALFARYPDAAALAHANPLEAEVTRMLPPEEWTGFSLRLILHGRRICIARTPRCPECVLNDFCPSSTVRAKGGRRPLTAIAASVRLAHGRGTPRKRPRRPGT